MCFTVQLFETLLALLGVFRTHAAVLGLLLQFQEIVHHLQSVYAQILVHVRFKLFPYVVVVHVYDYKQFSQNAQLQFSPVFYTYGNGPPHVVTSWAHE